MDNTPYPFTDREYEEGQYSQGFIFDLNSKHKTRNFSVLQGENKFDYEIVEDKKVIEKGEFTAQVSIPEQETFSRSQTCSQKYECVNVPVVEDDDKIKLSEECHWTTECTCPSEISSLLDNNWGKIVPYRFSRNHF